MQWLAAAESSSDLWSIVGGALGGGVIVELMRYLTKSGDRVWAEIGRLHGQNDEQQKEIEKLRDARHEQAQTIFKMQLSEQQHKEEIERLKEEINELCRSAGKAPKYPTVE